MRWNNVSKKKPHTNTLVYVQLRDRRIFTAYYIGTDDWIFSEHSMKELGIDSISLNMMYSYQIEKWSKQET